MVIFDKTGTLTEGKLKINRVYTSSSLDNLNLDNVDLNCSLLHNVNLDSSSLDNVNLDSNSLDNVNLDGNSLDNVNKEYVNKKDKVNLIESSSLYTYLNGSLNKELYTYRNIKDTYWNENILFNIILEIEKESFHDIADSLINYCEKRINKKIKDFQILKVKNVRGGIYAVIKRENRFFYIKIGNEKILKKRLKNKFNNIEYVNVNNVIDSIIDDYKIFVTINNKLILIFILEDSLTKNALEIINYLKERKIEIEILSGDSILNVKKIANKLKIKNYFGNLKCYEKLNIIKKYLKKNKKIIYIGDNINDYLSLKNSTIGISFSEIFSVGQLNFKKKDFLLLKILFEKSESINLKIKRNFTVSVIYNLFAFCFALLSTYSGRGMVPGISCFCMVLSSLSVILISR